MHLKTSSQTELYSCHTVVLLWNLDEIQDTSLWFVMLCHLLDECQRLRGMSCLWLQDQSAYASDASGHTGR